MSKTFLFSSAVLFIGGAVMSISGILDHYDLLWMLSIIFMLMGGIPLLCVWFKELFRLLPEKRKASEPNEK